MSDWDSINFRNVKLDMVCIVTRDEVSEEYWRKVMKFITQVEGIARNQKNETLKRIPALLKAKVDDQ